MSGILYIADFYKCKDLDPSRVKGHFLAALKAADLNIVSEDAYIFEDNEGVIMTAILKKAHAVLHTWPEKNIATIDIFCCDSKLKPMLSIVDLGGRLGSSKIDTNKSSRGTL